MDIPKTMTKTVKKYGNSGGVYLPSSWIGGEVEVRLMARPPNPEKDLPLALAGMMKHVVSILVYGSYARNDHSVDSDIDVIVVTDSHVRGIRIPERLEIMNYDIRVLSRDEIKRSLERDVVFRKSIEECKAVFNDSFLDELKRVKQTKKFSDRLALAKSSLRIMRSISEIGGDNTSLIYPLIMRIKEMLLIRCVLEKKRYSLKVLEGALRAKSITTSDFNGLMSHYRAVRDGKPSSCYKFREGVIVSLLELLGELIAYAEKKEKA